MVGMKKSIFKRVKEEIAKHAKVPLHGDSATAGKSAGLSAAALSTKTDRKAHEGSSKPVLHTIEESHDTRTSDEEVDNSKTVERRDHQVDIDIETAPTDDSSFVPPPTLHRGNPIPQSPGAFAMFPISPAGVDERHHDGRITESRSTGRHPNDAMITAAVTQGNNEGSIVVGAEVVDRQKRRKEIKRLRDRREWLYEGISRELASVSNEERDVLPAAIVDEQRTSDGGSFKRIFQMGILLTVVIIIGVVVGTVLAIDKDSKGVSTLDHGSQPPTQAPTVSPGSFGTPSELKEAVDEYLEDNSPNSSVAQKYGWPIGDWDVSFLDDFAHIFSAARNPAAKTFNENLANWNMSRARSLKDLFRASAFNNDISSWDTSNVRDLSGTFQYAESFNQDISRWNVSLVADMQACFFVATAFNQDLSGWDVSNVKNFEQMFSFADSFDGNISKWNTSAATHMKSMFEKALVFNQDISGWDVRNVLTFRDIFLGATSFNQSLCEWGKVIDPSVAVVSGMFDDTSCSTEGKGVDLSASPPGPFCMECKK